LISKRGVDSWIKIYRYVYTSRGRFRRVRRSLEDSVKLAYLSRELAMAYLEVVEWGEKRVLKLK